MDRIGKLIRNLGNYLNSINSYLGSATAAAEDTIIGMNVSQLYGSGEDRNGKKITPAYSPVTVAIKKRKGQPTDRVTLRDTGDFHSSFGIRYDSDGFEITASDWKTEILKGKYGDGILGLQDSMVSTLCNDYYRPRLISELKKATGHE